MTPRPVLDRDPNMDVCEVLATGITEICRHHQGIDVIIAVSGILTVALIEASPDLEVALQNVDAISRRMKNSLHLQLGN